LAILGAALAFALSGLVRPGSDRRVALRSAAAVTLLASLVLAASASAHDPGQGDQVMTADLLGRSEGSTASLAVRPERCAGIVPQRTVARRAGEERTSPLSPVGPCEFEGRISLPDRGRWFVYAEMTYQGEDVETWLPIESGDDDVVREPERSVYVPPDVDDPVVKRIAGVLVYAFLAAVLVAIPLVARRGPPPAAGAEVATS
jgi:hypothetical protein